MRKLWLVVVAVALAGAVGLVGGSDGGAAPAPVRAAGAEPAPDVMPLGAELIAAVVAHDFDRARSLLADTVELKGYTPSKGYFELQGAEAVMKLLAEWYEPADQSLEAIETGQVPGRHRVGYRVRWSTPEMGAHVFEQQAYYDVADGRISGLQLVCSGDRPVTAG